MARILFVDGDPHECAAFARLLEHNGYEVAVARDGGEGLAVYREQGADAIIADLVMPNGGGIEMILALLRESPQAKVIAIAGGGGTFSPESYLDVARSFGAVRTFTKPVNTEEFLVELRRQLRQ